MTVRRDLVMLHGEGGLLLLRGGAALPMEARFSFGSPQSDNTVAERPIAERTVPLADNRTFARSATLPAATPTVLPQAEMRLLVAS